MSARRNRIRPAPPATACDWCHAPTALALYRGDTRADQACADHAANLAPALLRARAADRRTRRDQRGPHPAHADGKPSSWPAGHRPPLTRRLRAYAKRLRVNGTAHLITWRAHRVPAPTVRDERGPR